MSEPIKVKIDVFSFADGKMVATDERTQLAMIAQLRSEVAAAQEFLDEYGGSYDFVPWPTFDEDMTTFSRGHPYLFACYFDDVEIVAGVQYFYGGSSYFAEAQISYPPFDPANLAGEADAIRVDMRRSGMI